MKREIKFRVWISEDGFMIGDVYPTGCKSFLISNPNMKGTFSEFNGEIMQYTGLKDKAGKQIFESDIVKKHNNGIGHIEFGRVLMDGTGSAYSGFFIRKLHGNYTNLDGTLEIIGNIYENPELLEQS